MTTSFPQPAPPTRTDRRTGTLFATPLAALLLAAVTAPSIAATASQVTLTFDLPAATTAATTRACRQTLKLDPLIRAFEAHPALMAEPRRLDSMDAIRADLTAHRVASNDLAFTDCQRDAPTSETACVVLPPDVAIVETRLSGNDGDLAKALQITGYVPALLEGDKPRRSGGRFAVIDVGYEIAQTSRSDRVTCVTARNWSAKPSRQAVQLRYGDPAAAAPQPR